MTKKKNYNKRLNLGLHIPYWELYKKRIGTIYTPCRYKKVTHKNTFHWFTKSVNEGIILPYRLIENQKDLWLSHSVQKKDWNNEESKCGKIKYKTLKNGRVKKWVDYTFKEWNND